MPGKFGNNEVHIKSLNILHAFDKYAQILGLTDRHAFNRVNQCYLELMTTLETLHVIMKWLLETGVINDDTAYQEIQITGQILYFLNCLVNIESDENSLCERVNISSALAKQVEEDELTLEEMKEHLSVITNPEVFMTLQTRQLLPNLDINQLQTSLAEAYTDPKKVLTFEFVTQFVKIRTPKMATMSIQIDEIGPHISDKTNKINQFFTQCDTPFLELIPIATRTPFQPINLPDSPLALRAQALSYRNIHSPSPRRASSSTGTGTNSNPGSTPSPEKTVLDDVTEHVDRLQKVSQPALYRY